MWHQEKFQKKIEVTRNEELFASFPLRFYKNRFLSQKTYKWGWIEKVMDKGRGTICFLRELF